MRPMLTCVRVAVWGNLVSVVEKIFTIFNAPKYRGSINLSLNHHN